MALAFVSIAVLALTPALAGGGISAGPWRDINPTQLATAGDAFVPGPDVPLNSVYVRSAGFGSVGAGEAWAVGGCGPTSAVAPVFPFSASGCVVAGSTPPGGGTIAYYDGFSWTIKGDPFVGQHSFYTGVNFCTSPGSPGVGLCSPNGDGSDGWIVGGNNTGPIAAYVTNPAVITPDVIGLPAGGYLTSVFETCHVTNDPNGLGCPTSLGAGQAYAAGTDGTHGVIFEYTGGAPSGLGGWHKMLVSGASATIYNSIYMFVDSTGNLEGFAVGDNGVIARFQIGSWVAVAAAPATTTFHGVAVDNNNPIDAWAVGFDTSAGGGVIWHFSSGTWSGPVSPSPVAKVTLESVHVLSTSEAWIVGTNSTILHGTNLPGSGFTSVSTAGSNVLFSGTGAGIDLNSVSFQSSGNGWSVGTHGVILQTSDSSCGSIVQTSSPSACWGGQTSIVQTTQLRAVYENNPSDAWAGGLYDNVSTYPSLIHWDGQKWHRANLASGGGFQITKPDIYGIYMVGGSEGYAVGAEANATGAKCGQLYCPAAYTWNVITSNWWQGVNVAQCPNSLGCNMTSVYFATIGPVDGWAVGSNGGIWTYSKSSPGWSFAATGLPGGFNATLNAIFINNPGNNNPAGWAVGNNGTILSLNCNAAPCVWSQQSITGLSNDVNLYGIYFSDSNHGWIVGSENTIITTTNNGGIWEIGSAALAPPTAVWRSIHVDSYGTRAGSAVGWAVGYNGTGPFSNSTGNALTAWWNGATWTNLPIPLAVTSGLGLYSVFTTNPTDGWAVGAQPSTGINDLAGIFHLDPIVPPTYGQTANSTTTAVSSSSQSTGVVSSASTVYSSATSATISTSTPTTAVVSTSVSTVTVSSTPTTTTSSSTNSVTTPMVLPAIPGFPWESIIAGLILGVIALAVLRRARKK